MALPMPTPPPKPRHLNSVPPHQPPRESRWLQLPRHVRLLAWVAPLMFLLGTRSDLIDLLPWNH